MTDLDRIHAFTDGIDDRAAERTAPFAWGTALVNERLWLVYDANFLRVERGSPSATELAAECERIQGPAGLTHRAVSVRAADAERLTAEFAALGWEADQNVVMVARRPPDRVRDLDRVAEVTHDDLRTVWADGVRAEPYRLSGEVVEQLVDHKRVVAEAVPTRYFAASVNGAIASYCELYSLGGTGQIESVLTLPAYRGQGLAAAVVLRALAESRRAGNDLTFLTADRDDWPRRLYVRLGFDGIGGYARFRRRDVA